MGRMIQIVCGAVLALGVIGFALWSLLVFEPAIPLNADQPTSQPDAQYQAGGAECRAERLQRMPAEKREAKETECAQEREDHRKEQADLVQQTRAANAGQILVSLTKDQTGIALLQAVLSILGVIATALAAWAAVVAARAARDSVEDADAALKHAAASAAAATKMAEVTAEHGKLQIEAGLHFGYARLTVVPDGFWLIVTLKNVRPTAAINLAGSVTFTFDLPDQPPIVETFPLEFGSTEVHESGETSLIGKWSKIGEDVRAQICTSSSFEVCAHYHWETVFREKLERTVFLSPRAPEPFSFPAPGPGAHADINLIQTKTTPARTKLGGEG